MRVSYRKKELMQIRSTNATQFATIPVALEPPAVFVLFFFATAILFVFVLSGAAVVLMIN